MKAKLKILKSEPVDRVLRKDVVTSEDTWSFKVKPLLQFLVLIQDCDLDYIIGDQVTLRLDGVQVSCTVIGKLDRVIQCISNDSWDTYFFQEPKLQ